MRRIGVFPSHASESNAKSEFRNPREIRRPNAESRIRPSTCKHRESLCHDFALHDFASSAFLHPESFRGCVSSRLCVSSPFSSWVVPPLLWVLCAQSCSYPHKNLVFAHRVSDFKVLAQRHLVRQTRSMKMWPAMVLPIAAL